MIRVLNEPDGNHKLCTKPLKPNVRFFYKTDPMNSSMLEKMDKYCVYTAEK